MAKRLQSRTIDFPFYSYLQNFIEQERKRVYSAFKPLTKSFSVSTTQKKTVLPICGNRNLRLWRCMYS